MNNPKVEETEPVNNLANDIKVDPDENRYSQRPSEKDQEPISQNFDALQQTMSEHFDTLSNQIDNMQSNLNTILEKNCQSIQQTQSNIQDFLNKMSN